MTHNNSLYSNNSRTLTTGAISNSSPTIPVVSTSLFPTISVAGDYFYVTLDDNINVEIVKVGGTTGSSFTSCVRGQQGTTAVAFGSNTKVERRMTAGELANLARLSDRMADYASVDLLPTPASVDGNSALCALGDEAGVPVLAVVSSTKWRFLNYSFIAYTGTTGAGATTTSINLATASTFLPNTSARGYIIQFTSGVNLGLCRVVTGITSSVVSWATALPTPSGGSDTYEVYQGTLHDASNEAAIRAAADVALGTSISNEAINRANADSALHVTLSGDIATEASIRSGADGTLSGLISTETTNRTNADLLLMPKSGGIFTGTVQMAANAALPLSPVTLQQLGSSSGLTGGSGHVRLVGGLTIQWGNWQPTGEGAGTGDIVGARHEHVFTFPVPFTSSPLPPLLSYKEENDSSYSGDWGSMPDIFLAWFGLSATGFTLLAKEQESKIQKATFYYVAIGYTAS